MLSMVALLVTWSALIRTEPGTHVGPLYLHETFAQVQQTLGAAPVTRSDCDTAIVVGCSPTMTYTDGANTLVISSEILTPYPSKLTLESQDVKEIELVRNKSIGAPVISRPGVHPLKSWTWASFGVFAPPPGTVVGWKRSTSGGDVFYDKQICGFTAGDPNPEGQMSFDAHRYRNAQGQWEFSLVYIEFAERC
jgi:hypothetical protein